MRFAAGDDANALQLLSNEWGPMTVPGDLYTGTFWENDSPTGTQATSQTNMSHGWSTMPTSALSKYVLGIQPVDAGYQTWLVRPHPGDLAWTRGQAPTPHGPVVVAWSHNRTSGHFAMRVEAPTGTSGTIAVPTFGHSIDIEVNGHKVWSHGHAIGSAALHGDYIDLAVGSGTYDVTTALDRTGR
jgi:alpha-L-rhamnosidase